MRLLINIPIPVPSVVLKFIVVGFGEVLQQTPRAITLAPPSEVTFPPLMAVDVVMLVMTVVGESVGNASVTLVVKLTSEA